MSIEAIGGSLEKDEIFKKEEPPSTWNGREVQCKPLDEDEAVIRIIAMVHLAARNQSPQAVRKLEQEIYALGPLLEEESEEVEDDSDPEWDALMAFVQAHACEMTPEFFQSEERVKLLLNDSTRFKPDLIVLYRKSWKDRIVKAVRNQGREIRKAVKEGGRFLKEHKKEAIAVAVVATAVAVVILTQGAAAEPAAAASAAAVGNVIHDKRSHRKDDNDQSSSPPQSSSSSSPPPPSSPPVNAFPSHFPTYHTGTTPPIGEHAKSFTLTPSEIKADRPSTFDPMPYVWTPPSSRVPDATPYYNSQEYQSLVHSPLIKQPPAEHNFSQHPRINPDNRFSNQGPSSSSSTITPPYSASGQILSILKSPYTPGVENFSNAFPLISSHRFRLPTGPGALPPTFNPSSNTTLSYQELGQRALAAGNYPQAVQEFSRAIETNPTNPSSYLERGVAHFGLGQYDRSLDDYRNYTSQTQKTYPLSVAEFSLGFAKGLPKGIYDSGSGLFLFMSDLVKHPVNTGKQMWDSLALLSQLARSEEWSALGEALASEVHQLVKEWDTLPSDKRGELAGYAFGKYGADILIPGAVAKAVSKGVKGAQELSIVYRGLKTAEQTLLLESVAELGSGAKIGEVFQAHQKTVALGKELGFSTREMFQLKQAGQLEGTVARTFENVFKNPAMHESFEFFKKAETFLEPYSKQFMLEAQARVLIHKTGVQTFPRPSGIPETFRVRITKNGAGILYVHPEHTHTSVRVMPGKLHSPNPSQQKPYVIYKKDGNTLDKFGNTVNSSSPKAHIPIEEFVFKD